MQTPTTIEIIRELKREITMRRRVYPGLIARGTLSQQQADRQIQLLEAAIELINANQPQQGELFTTA